MLRLNSVIASWTLALVLALFAHTAAAQEQAPPPDPFAPADQLASPVAPADGPAAAAPATVVIVAQPPAGYQTAAAPQAQPYQQPAAYPGPPAPTPLPPRSAGLAMADVGGGLVGLGLGSLAMYAMLRNSRDFGDALGAIIFGPVIMFWLTDLGIYSFGRMTGGHGSFWLTTAGTAAGAGLGALLGFQVIARAADYSDASVWAGLGLTAAFAIAGGTAVFELTDRRNRRRSAQGYAFTPYVAPTRGGATFGIGATF